MILDKEVQRIHLGFTLIKEKSKEGGQKLVTRAQIEDCDLIC